MNRQIILKHKIINLCLLFAVIGVLAACSRTEPAPFRWGDRAQTLQEYRNLKGIVDIEPVKKKSKFFSLDWIGIKDKKEKVQTIPKTYIVKPEDTLFSIAQKQGVSLTKLIKINNKKPPYSMDAGEVLTLPEKSFGAVEKLSVGATTTEQNLYKYFSVPKRSSYTFKKPVNGQVISYFGNKADGVRNDGINIAAKKGDPVESAENGVVVYASDKIKGLGNIILIKHGDNWVSAYAHLEEILVGKGEIVSRGDKIATIGDTGSVDTAQLHFEIRNKTRPVNPIPYLR